MGMYDDIICRYPLPGEPPSFCVKEGRRFQSKSLDCLMATYEITESGELLQTGEMYGALEKPEPVTFHGVLEFYTSNWAALAHGVKFTANGEDFESVTYEAIFVSGKVQSIVETEREREPALARFVLDEIDALFDKSEPEVTMTEPEVGQPMYLQWGGGSKGYPVTFLAKTQLEWVVANERGKVDTLHPSDLGRLLFHSQEESDGMKAWEKEAREQKTSYAKRLLEGKPAAAPLPPPAVTVEREDETMTGYYLEPGYQSGASREEAWEALKRITLEICDSPERIMQEAVDFGAKLTAEGDSIDVYAESYRERTDLTIRIIEREDDLRLDPEDRKAHVVQYASGGGESRVMKEHLRRAFCRLAIREMHMLGYEVNMTVA